MSYMTSTLILLLRDTSTDTDKKMTLNNECDVKFICFDIGIIY